MLEEDISIRSDYLNINHMRSGYIVRLFYYEAYAVFKPIMEAEKGFLKKDILKSMP